MSEATPPEVVITVGRSAIDPRDPLAKMREAVEALLGVNWEAFGDDVRCAAWNHANVLAAQLGNWSRNAAKDAADKLSGEDQRRGGPGEFTQADWADAVKAAEQPGGR